MEDNDVMMASEPAAAVLSESVRKTGLLSQVMKLSPSDKKALIAYLQKDIAPEETFKTDSSGRIMLSSKMRDDVIQAQNDLKAGRCYSEESFQQRFAKWL
jgi:hypothetical protein